MPIMWQSSGERRTIVERVLGSTLRELQTCLEGIDLAPELDDLLFLLWKVELSRNCYEKELSSSLRSKWDVNVLSWGANDILERLF